MIFSMFTITIFHSSCERIQLRIKIYRSFSLSGNKKINENHSVNKVKKMRCYRRYIKKTFLEVLNLCVIPKRRYLSKCFDQIYGAQYGAAILVYKFSTPTWRTENSVNIWNLLRFSWPLNFCSLQRNIHISIFSTTLTSKTAENHKING